MNNFFATRWHKIGWTALSLLYKPNLKPMTTVKTNIWNLEAGDRITFTNRANCKQDILVNRVEEKSWYATGRNSWGTLQSYAKYPDFLIIKKGQ
jgi:hypothetical protein